MTEQRILNKQEHISTMLNEYALQANLVKEKLDESMLKMLRNKIVTADNYDNALECNTIILEQILTLFAMLVHDCDYDIKKTVRYTRPGGILSEEDLKNLMQHQKNKPLQVTRTDIPKHITDDIEART